MAPMFEVDRDHRTTPEVVKISKASNILEYVLFWRPRPLVHGIYKHEYPPQFGDVAAILAWRCRFGAKATS